MLSCKEHGEAGGTVSSTVCRALYVKHCLVAFSRSVSESMQNTALCLEDSPEFLECCPDEKLLQATYGPVGAGWGHWIQGSSPSLSSMICDTVQQGISGARKGKALVRDAEGTASKTFPI